MLPPGLSMLWESADPSEALAGRFGFTGFDAAAAWLATALEGTWGLTPGPCTRLVISDRNAIAWVGGLVVKWSCAPERFARLDAAARLLRDLAGLGAPVAAPLATTSGRDRAVLAGPAGPLSVVVLPEVEGDWLDVADPVAVHAAGACLARLHRDLATARPAVGPVGPPPAEAVRDWLARQDPGHVPAASRRLADLLDAAPVLEDGTQLVHLDFRAANVLTRGSSVVAVLDFDEVAPGHRVVDLAKASVHLGTRFTGWRPTPAPAQRTFRRGYESVRPLAPAEARWFEALLLWLGLQAVPGPDDPGGWAAAARRAARPADGDRVEFPPAAP